MYFFFFSEKPYIAVIGDIIDSKKLENRAETQKILARVLQDVNQEYKGEIASNFMITLGDEFQGLLHKGKYTMEIIDRIQIEMHPVQLRIGIGVGDILTEFDSNHPLGADGPAYHNARYMIDLIKNQPKTKSVARTLIHSGQRNEKTDILLNTILNLCCTVKNKWTEKQIRLIKTYISCSKNQTVTAEHLGLAQSTVQRGLTSADYHTYEESMKIVSLALSEIGETEYD